VTEASTKNW